MSSSRKSDYLRFWQILKTYGSPYWKSFVLLVAINILVTFFATSVSMSQASLIGVLTGKDAAEQVETRPEVTIGNLRLGNLDQVILQNLGIDQIEGLFQKIAVLGVFLMVTMSARELLIYGSNILGARIGLNTGRALQYDLFSHLMRFSLGFFNKQRAGELMSRLEADTRGSVSGFHDAVYSLVVAPLLIIFYGMIIIRESWILVAAIVVAGVIQILITKFLNKPIQVLTRKSLDINADIKAVMQETLASMRVVKSFGAEDFERKRLDANQRKLVWNNLKNKCLNDFQKPLRNLSGQVVQLCILLFAAYELSRGAIDLKTCLLFVIICNAIVAPIKHLGNVYVTIYTMVTSSGKVYEFFSEQPEVKEGDLEVTGFRDQIELQNVSFSYDDQPVLNELNLVIKKGEVVAVVGPSGAGKSTLVDLILRFYDPKSGRILMDGEDLKNFKQRPYRRLFGIVSQESLLFNTTVENNIKYGRGYLDHEAVQEAAKIANAQAFIEQMEEDYQTEVGDRGVRVSGGQRQRLAIARAVVGKPEVLILDEATSSLDSESEKEVQQAIDRVTESTTAIIIAHRLSTVLHADKIVVMEKGRIIDQGKHAELLERCPLYKRLCELQFNDQMVRKMQNVLKGEN